MARAAFLAILLMLLSSPAAVLFAAGPEAGISLNTDDRGRRVFDLRGLALKQAAAIADLSKPPFAIYNVCESELADLPALAGKYTNLPDGLRFAPRFPLEPGMRYRAVYTTGGEKLEKEFVIPPRAASAPARVRAIYPSAKILPQNQLKFYVHFTAAMSRGDAYRHFALLDADGELVDLPFLELSEELWNPAGDRLTLLLDPARVKRDLKPRNESGPVLEVGKRYSLLVRRDFKDAQGRPLAAEFHKEFAVAEPDEGRPRPASWRLTMPAAGTFEPLVVNFGEPLDHALLGRWLWMEDAAGQDVPGEGAPGEGESTWSFRPRQHWHPGRYRLMADKRLEDLAGNNIARKFELDGRGSAEASAEEGAAAVEFEVQVDGRR